MPFISLQEQGYFNPADIIQESIRKSLAARAQQQQIEQDSKRFATEQKVREAESEPVIDPNVIRNRVIAAQGLSRVGAMDADFLAGQPTYGLRKAYESGRMPTMAETSSAIGPNGGSVTTTRNRIGTGETGPDGQPLFAPFGGSTTATPPQVRTATRIVPAQPGAPSTPGLAIVETVNYVLKDPSKPDTEDNRQVVDTKQTTQRVTPPRGNEALIAMLDDPDLDPEVEAAIRGVLNKQSATAPSDPNAIKPTAEWAQNNADIVKLSAQSRQATDPDIKARIDAQIGELEARNKFLSTPKKTAADTLSDLLGADTPANQPQTDASGTSEGSKMPPAAAANIAAARAAEPASAATGGLPNPANPARPAQTGAAQAKSAAQQFEVGKIYRDAQGNRAKWNGSTFDPIPAGQ